MVAHWQPQCPLTLSICRGRASIWAVLASLLLSIHGKAATSRSRPACYDNVTSCASTWPHFINL